MGVFLIQERHELLCLTLFVRALKRLLQVLACVLLPALTLVVGAPGMGGRKMLQNLFYLWHHALISYGVGVKTQGMFHWVFSGPILHFSHKTVSMLEVSGPEIFTRYNSYSYTGSDISHNSSRITWNGAFPVRHWNTIVPNDQRSAFASYCRDMITSGA